MLSINSNIKSKLRPYLIGIAGGSTSGKTAVLEKITDLFENFPVCKISLDSYYKDLSEEALSKIEEYNFDQPDAFDFDLLEKHIMSLLKGQSIQMPTYDYIHNKRTTETITVKSSPVIVLEGILVFYDRRILNLMDLKIFIETESDICLSRRIMRDISERKRNLTDIIMRYHNHVKPAYENFIGPTKKFADIIIPNGEANELAINIVSEYMKMQLDKVLSQENLPLFTSINEIIDPKHKYFDKKILVPQQDKHVQYIKTVFEEFISGKYNGNKEQCDSIINELNKLLLDSLIVYFRSKSYFNEVLPSIDLVVCENDDIDKIEWKKYKNIIFFKTTILNEEDMLIFDNIFTQNKKCVLLINALFLAPKFGEQILGNRVNHILLNSLYFSDFFVKFEQIIKDDNELFNFGVISDKFKQEALNKFK